MSPEQAKTICDFLTSNLEHEAKTTKKVIAAVPAGQCDYTPDVKSMKCLDLAWHIASSEVNLLDVAIAGGDATPPERPSGTDTPEGVAAWYETNQQATLQKVKDLHPEHLAKVITVWGMFSMPAVNFVGMALSHGIHHRGQLSAYLRPMGGKVPAIYGPSGDEAMAH